KAAAATEGAATAAFKGSTAIFQPAFKHTPVATAVSAATLDRVVQALTTVPADFKVHSKIKRFTEGRAEAHKNGGPYDWGMGEALAVGTLLLDGLPVRLSGQDCERGTFTHRHAVFNDTETGAKYTPLNNIAE